MTTVFVLAVLWLIVVVPMIVRGRDARRQEKSVAGFGRAMRALGRQPSVDREHVEIYVPSRAVRTARPDRRPVLAAQEALMYPVDRSELSEARQHMMKRRRRSLRILIGGSVIFGLLAVMLGGLLWALAVPFLLGLTGYVWFLRGQARRDRERRAGRQRRATERRGHGADLTEHAEFSPVTVTDTVAAEEATVTMVRIDDDDLDLHNMDTMDLTGFYEEELAAQASAERRAS